MWIARNPPGFAFIEFEDAQDAADAVRDVNGRKILGKEVRVEISRRGRGGGGGGGGGGERRGGAYVPRERAGDYGNSR